MKSAEHAVAIEPIGEIGVSRAADDVELVPIGACLRVQHRPQPLEIEVNVFLRSGIAKELPELGVVRKRPKPAILS